MKVQMPDLHTDSSGANETQSELLLTSSSSGHSPPRNPNLQEELADLIRRCALPLNASTSIDSPHYHPVIAEFKSLIEEDAYLYMLFHQMFEQIPTTSPFNNDPSGKPQVRDYQTMLACLNLILRRAPSFQKIGVKVEVPVAYIFEWPMGTPAGNAVFLHPKVNSQLKKILNEWARFLSSPDSCYVLNDDPESGWFGQAALAAMPSFVATYICKPHLPHYGFTSWDGFFTRRFRPGVRPIASPHEDSVILNACESAPYRLAHNVKERDNFWLKEQPYSLTHMLASDQFAPQFVGGTLLQAYLSSTSYHRWHSPVSGTVLKAYVVPGAYYSESLVHGFDPTGPDKSEAYITQVATRAIIFIQADNLAIGLTCFLAVGMCEISSCEITVYDGQKVKKGDQLGIFHVGGSTWCLIVRPEVKVKFDLRGQNPRWGADIIPINAAIATVEGRDG